MKKLFSLMLAMTMVAGVFAQTDALYYELMPTKLKRLCVLLALR